MIRIRFRDNYPDPGPVLDQTNSNFFLNFFCLRFKTHNNVFFVVNHRDFLFYLKKRKNVQFSYALYLLGAEIFCVAPAPIFFAAI